MKKLFVMLVLLMAVMLPITGMAATQIFDASQANYCSGVINGTSCTLPVGTAIGFSVDMTGIQSVSIKAILSTSNNFDGDIVWIRLDSPTGTPIGKINFHSEDESVFSCPISQTTGVHNVYIYSHAGLEDVVHMESFTFSADPYDGPSGYTPTPVSEIRDMDADNWTVYDRLGRTLPDYEEAGALKGNKTVGMFYWTWHASFDGRKVVNINDFIYAYPEARFDYNYPAWQGSFDCGYFWNEPIWGFYSGKDEWVLRRQMEMFAAAGIDTLIFDCSNGQISWKVGYNTLFSVMHQMREEGYPTPQATFLSNFGAIPATNVFLRHVYLDIYQDGKYSDLWFYWNGKPLMLAYDNAVVTNSGDAHYNAIGSQIKNFFTFRRPQANYTGGGSGSQWGWLEVYPQNLYNGEEMTVGTSVNHSFATNKITAMNDSNVMGRSYTKTFTDDNRAGAYQYGYFFDEQWRRALSVSPAFVFVTGWNEWTAGRHEVWMNITNAFPDQFDNEGSRDIEPTVEPLMQDNYYYQLVENVRKYKGVSAPQVASGLKTIDMTDISSWDDVSPTYYNFAAGPDRNCNGYDDRTYTNTTSRNNIIESKVARDHDYIYFMAKTEEPITSSSGSAWMRLLIDTDRNYGTGWEGYDYIVNRKKPLGDTSAQLEKNKGNDWTWVACDDVEYSLLDDYYLVIKIKKDSLGLAEPIDLSFKWSDNAQTDGDIYEFWYNGETAPIGRYAYRYVTQAPTTVDANARANLSSAIGFYVGSTKANYRGGMINLSDENASLTAKMIDGYLYVPYYCVMDGLNTKAWWYASSKNLVIQGQHKTISMVVDNPGATTRNGVAFSTLPLKMVDGYPYIAVQTLADAFEMSSIKLDNGNFHMVSYGSVSSTYARVAANHLIGTKKISIQGRALLGETLTVNPTGSPVKYCWMSSSSPNGPWTGNGWTNSKSFVINELAAGQYIKVRVFDTNDAYYDSYAIRDLSSIDNVIYHDTTETTIDATSGTKNVNFKDEAMLNAVPTSGRWVISYKYKRNDACCHIDNQAFDSTGNHIVYSFYNVMDASYFWGVGSEIYTVHVGLPSANEWHTVSYLFDFDKNEYGVSCDGSQPIYGTYNGGFIGFCFNIYEGVFTVKDFMIHGMKNNSAPVIQDVELTNSNWGALSLTMEVTDYEKDAVTVDYEWQYADRINGEYTTFANTDIPYYSTADSTIYNKYIRAKINAKDARGLEAEPYLTKPVKQPTIGDVLYGQEFYTIPDTIEYVMGDGQNTYLSKDSLVIDRNNATVDSYITDRFDTAPQGKVVFETKLMKDMANTNMVLSIYGNTKATEETASTEVEIFRVTFPAATTMVYYSTATKATVRPLPQYKLLKDTWRVLTVELDTETDKFSMYSDGKLAVGNLFMYSYAAGHDIESISGYKWSAESTEGEGIFDYIRMTTYDEPSLYTAVTQNGVLTDTLAEGKASVTCAYPEDGTGMLFAALYEHGRLVKIIRTDETDLETEFDITSPETAEIKVMYWGATETLLPLDRAYDYGYMAEQ